MEVISIPLKGYLRHGDSVQNTKTITPGDIQVMSTGSGIYHSEYNYNRQIKKFPTEKQNVSLKHILT